MLGMIHLTRWPQNSMISSLLTIFHFKIPVLAIISMVITTMEDFIITNSLTNSKTSTQITAFCICSSTYPTALRPTIFFLPHQDFQFIKSTSFLLFTTFSHELSKSSWSITKMTCRHIVVYVCPPGLFLDIAEFHSYNSTSLLCSISSGILLFLEPITSIPTLETLPLLVPVFFPQILIWLAVSSCFIYIYFFSRHLLLLEIISCIYLFLVCWLSPQEHIISINARVIAYSLLYDKYLEFCMEQ